MTKFPDAEDPGYQRVSGELWIWTRDLQKRRNTQRSEVSASSQIKSGTFPTQEGSKPQFLLEDGDVGRPTQNYFQGSMTNVGSVFQGNSIGSMRNEGQSRW